MFWIVGGRCARRKPTQQERAEKVVWQVKCDNHNMGLVTSHVIFFPFSVVFPFASSSLSETSPTHTWGLNTFFEKPSSVNHFLIETSVQLPKDRSIFPEPSSSNQFFFPMLSFHWMFFSMQFCPQVSCWLMPVFPPLHLSLFVSPLFWLLHHLSSSLLFPTFCSGKHRWILVHHEQPVFTVRFWSGRQKV